jgi:ABC-type sugar transport system substrate-binding protein
MVVLSHSTAVEALKSLYKQKGPAVLAIVEKSSATLDAAVNKAANAAIEVIVKRSRSVLFLPCWILSSRFH